MSFTSLSLFSQKVDYFPLYALQVFLKSETLTFRFTFKFSDPEPLFRFLYGEHVAKRIELADILTLDYEIKEMIYETMKEDVDGGNKLVLCI